MKREELMRLLEDNYVKSGYNENDIRLVRPYFNELSGTIIKKLLYLEINEFSEYVNFIKRFIVNKKGTYGYVDILEYITNLMVQVFDSKNTRFLMNLLTETNIIENANIKEFSYIFINELDRRKADVTRKVLLAYQDKVIRMDIAGLVMTLNELDDDTISNLYEFLDNLELRREKNYLRYLDLLIENINHENVDLYFNVLQNKNFIRKNNAIEIIRNYVFSNNSNFEKSKVINCILTDEILVNSSYLNKILASIDNLAIGLYPYIKGLVKCSDLVNEEVFYTLFTGLLKSKTKGQGYSILKLVDYKKLHKNNMRLTYLINCIIKMDSIALKELDRYLANLEKNKDIVEINPHDKEFSLVLDSLSKVKYAEQAVSIVDLSSYFKNLESKYIIDFILNSKKEEDTIYLKRIIKVPNIISSGKLEVILNNLLEVKSEKHFNIFMRIISTSKYLKLNNLGYVLSTINSIDEFNLYMVDNFLLEVIKSSNSSLILNNDNKNNNIFLKLLRLYRTDINNKQHTCLISLLENASVLSNEVNLDYFINIIFKVKEEFKLVAIFKYLYANLEDGKTISIDNKDYVDYICLSTKDYQARCLVLISSVIADYEGKLNVIKSILESKNSMTCHFIYTLLNIPDILNNANFEVALYELSHSNKDFQMRGIVNIFNIPILADTNLGRDIFNFINNTKTSKQVEVIIRVLKENPDFYLEDLEFNLLIEVLKTTDEKRLIALEEIFINYRHLGYLKTTDLVSEVMNYDTKEYREKFGKETFKDVVDNIIDNISDYNLVSAELEELSGKNKKLLKHFK